jgi:hypothetical protein
MENAATLRTCSNLGNLHGLKGGHVLAAPLLEEALEGMCKVGSAIRRVRPAAMGGMQ